MSGTGMQGHEFDFEKYRLRRFVDRLIALDEVEIHEEAVPLTGLAPIIEGTRKAVLFKQAGPERVEMIAKSMAGRKRLEAALETTPEKAYEELLRRIANQKKSIEVPSDEAPVHAIKLTGKDIDLTKLPFYPQHEFDGSCYISSGIDYVNDPITGRSNVGSRRLALRNRTQCGTNITAPSDLKRIYMACAQRRERLPITFTLGAHPLDFIAATTRLQGDEYHMISNMRGESAPFVKSLTNDILVPADAEIVIEGYLDERGYFEPEGPYGEYMGYYGAIHMDPLFTCTAITMRKDVMYQTLQHGSAFVLDQTDSACITELRTEAAAMRILKNVVTEPVAVSSRTLSGKAMDPSLQGRRTGAKAGFDCTKPFGRLEEIVQVRCAAKVYGAPARFQTVEQALEAGPLYYGHLVEAVGSSDGREVAMALDALREKGRLGRDKDGRYHLVTDGEPGLTKIVGQLYHDPNHGI